MNESNQNPKKGIYFLPSLFTTAGLFFGFYAIIQATQGHFAQAALGVMIAMFMDGLDGRVARWTHTASDFGKQYDSLVDVIAFGIAPGLIMYFWSLHYLGKAGWLISFVYAAATALRLARFNALTVKDNRYFSGMACPAAAAFMVFWVWNFDASGISAAAMAWVSAGATLLMALLMVSNVKFRSFKDFDPKHKISFFVLVAIVGTVVLISFSPPTVLFLIAIAYTLSGPVEMIIRRRRGESTHVFFADEDELTNDTETPEPPAESASPKGEDDKKKSGLSARH